MILAFNGVIDWILNKVDKNENLKLSEKILLSKEIYTIDIIIKTSSYLDIKEQTEKYINILEDVKNIVSHKNFEIIDVLEVMKNEFKGDEQFAQVCRDHGIGLD